VHLSTLDLLLWAAGFLLDVALVFVLFGRGRARAVPWFTGWIVFGCLYTVTLFLIYRLGSKHLYFVVYWAGAFIDLLFQVATVLEVARQVFLRRGQWVEGARGRFLTLAATAPAVGIALAVMMTPAAETKLDQWDARASLFTTALICILVSAVMTVSRQLGLGWRSRVLRESYGLVLWSLVSFVTDSLHSYWRTLGHFGALEDVRIAVFQAVTVYWAIIFWLPEKESGRMPESVALDVQRLRSTLDYQQQREQTESGVSRR
jgi:hypothetical protein